LWQSLRGNYCIFISGNIAEELFYRDGNSGTSDLKNIKYLSNFFSPEETEFLATETKKLLILCWPTVTWLALELVKNGIVCSPPLPRIKDWPPAMPKKAAA
jgi:hypothetical protein